VMVSGIDRTDAALRAGATCFLNYDEWLRVGSLVTDLLGRSQAVQEAIQAERNEGGVRRPPSPTQPGVRNISSGAACPPDATPA
jgi:hypothetical protein